MIEQIFSSWPEAGKFISILLTIQIVLRLVAEILTRISSLTGNNNSKIVGWISELLWLLGVITGKLGYGVPKLVIEETREANKNK